MLTTYVDVGITLLIILWGGITALMCVTQLISRFGTCPNWLEATYRFLKKRDVLGLAPIWAFFSNEHGLRNRYHLYVRGFCHDCSTTDWKDVTPVGRDGRIRFFHPSRRPYHAVVKTLKTLVQAADDCPLYVSEWEAPETVLNLRRYYFLRQYIESQEFDASVERYQMLIALDEECIDDETREQDASSPAQAAHFGFSVPNRRECFISPFHKLSNGRTLSLDRYGKVDDESAVRADDRIDRSSHTDRSRSEDRTSVSNQKKKVSVVS